VRLTCSGAVFWREAMCNVKAMTEAWPSTEMMREISEHRGSLTLMQKASSEREKIEATVSPLKEMKRPVRQRNVCLQA